MLGSLSTSFQFTDQKYFRLIANLLPKTGKTGDQRHAVFQPKHGALPLTSTRCFRMIFI